MKHRHPQGWRLPFGLAERLPGPTTRPRGLVARHLLILGLLAPVLALSGTVLPLVAQSPVPAPQATVDATSEYPYSYVDAVEGTAYLIAADGSDREDLEVNFPVVTGDGITLSRRARLDLVFAECRSPER